MKKISLIRKVIFTILLILIPTYIYSEPSKPFQYLMDDKLTMLDWGLHRLGEKVNEMDFEEYSLINDTSFVNYNWDNNRLELFIIVYPKNKNVIDGKEKLLCKEITNKVRRYFLTERTDAWRDILGVSSNFRHKIGQIESNQPRNFRDEIENATIINVNIMSRAALAKDDTLYKSIINCESPLMGKKILFVEHE